MPADRDEPTTGEIVRRLDAIAGQLTEVIREIKDDRAHNAETYVRQDVYIAQRLADQAVVADVASDVRSIKDDRKAEESKKRAQNLTLALFAITTVVTLALGIANLLTR